MSLCCARTFCRARGRDRPAPGLASEIAPDDSDPLGVNPQQARDVARWRKAERARLIADRACHDGTGLAAPVFRPWTPGADVKRGMWNIMVPVTVQTLTPDIVLAPPVGWDPQGFRLGYFDRTLRPRRLTISLGHEAARLATICPQPHDVGLDAIVTEAGVQVRR